jgi:hypothetical protein
VSETVVVTVPDPDPDPAPVVVQAPHDDGAAVVAAETAQAVGDAVADTVASIQAADAAEGQSEALATASRLDAIELQLAAVLAGLTERAEPEPEPEVAVLEDDETVPDRAHPWFRTLDSWRGAS